MSFSRSQPATSGRAEPADAAARQRIAGVGLGVAQRVAHQELQSLVIAPLELGLQRVVRAHADRPDEERPAREVGPLHVRLRVGPRRQQLRARCSCR